MIGGAFAEQRVGWVPGATVQGEGVIPTQSIDKFRSQPGDGLQYHLAGLLEDMDYGPGIALGDPQLRFHFARVDKLPRAAKNLIISIIEAVIIYLEANEIES